MRARPASTPDAASSPQRPNTEEELASIRPKAEQAARKETDCNCRIRCRPRKRTGAGRNPVATPPAAEVGDTVHPLRNASAP
ncbi:hypothetical protein ACFCXA_35290 [Streptomyces virginiae]|uniref:hypothetical protein n=1 Tax=Streptomyces virginiae TaxID=1961 RepID=UPI00325447BF